MTRFTDQNTEGYDVTDLAALNDALARVLAKHADWLASANEDVRKSYEDHVSERLLAAYDVGKRGNALTC